MKKFLILLLFPVFAYAGNCDSLYPNNKEFVVPNTVELCNSFYAVRYNEKLSAPVVTTAVIVTHSSHGRDGSFVEDQRVSKPRATSSRYVKTGYDRGHMVAAEDAATHAQMRETFLLTNVVPQNPQLNRGTWKELEAYIRFRARHSDAKVITGAVYNTVQPKLMNGIPVPDALYKILYVDGTTQAFYADNKSDGAVRRVSMEDLEAYSGLVFPR